MKHLIIILSLIISVAANGQVLTAELTIGEGVTSIDICKDKAVAFSAKAYLDGEETTEAVFSMDFDDGNIVNNTSDGTFNHSFAKGGIYMPMVKATYNGLSVYAKVTVNIGERPDFSKFSTDIPEQQQGICLGESVVLDIPIESQKVSYNQTLKHTELLPQSLYGKEWNAAIRIKAFDDATITDGSEIESITVKMVHHNVGSSKVVITCPNGISATIKDFGTNDYVLGIPDTKGFGTLYNYTFATNAQTTLNAATPSGDATSLPEGRYQSDEDFSVLAGCPLNGDWTITVSSQSTDYEGYAEEFSINLANSFTDTYKTERTQTYDTRRAVWTGTGVSATSEGKCSVTPQEYDITRYNYLISDNFGCFHDTTIYINVEKPTFTGGGDSTTFIGDEVEFNNRTTWAAQSHWSFGDKTPDVDGNPAPHAFYEKAVYTVILQSISASGCNDRDTQRINIVPRPLEIKEVNIFTPNGDGQNDIFTFFDPE
ncbi:MAG: hypothetical protein J5826_07340, partial [Bacteroidales bacterium]|nr:hypothetical protein [Bacteroidales bacterium]